MSDPDPRSLDALFIAAFNKILHEIDSMARVALPAPGEARDMIELQDDEGLVLALIPADTSPQLAAIAYRLYGQALNRGVRAGEDAAWAKLRHLIGAAAA